MLKKLLLLAALFASFPALAAYPDHPVRIMVSNPAGGPVDVFLRVLATRLSQTWNQSVVVENRPGASGIILGNALVKAAPDGYTLGMVVASSLTVVPFAVDNPPFDVQKDLQPISLVARTPFIFVVPKDSPIKTWQDFVAASKQRDLTIGSFSIGTAFHLVWEQTARAAGVKAVYAPSPSSGKTLGDLIGGQLDIALDAPSSAKGMIDAGRLRAIATTSPTRFPGLPDTPTLDESGLKGYSSQPWFALMAPAGTPAAVVDKIQKTVADLLKDPAMKAQMQIYGMTPVGSTPAELAETIKNDLRDMGPLVKELGIKL
ncbi:Bug family tripartite tricarboxylate transporter substrate binding protein [Pigmentiphaga litoralis]|uniref:Tripartite-type tricarboxylate transporter receptor subunit TctC n=1 Tax=Pigmentiphaga litoralis TaxID=516702 RepID=A0A7Y9IXK6_9BURK|nr:tripartite-type tricarboxylate transporter receptor subunit TctC [Pigmentiphaga litoralis]NYE84308.1 tripartite-type tricarboxylate transporter receptor subunit TctC [Pigmentiphaga litoralis]